MDRSYSSFYRMKNIILDQWSLPECSIYATLNCLERMKPWIDIYAILEEMRPDFKKIMSHTAALRWLKRKWYIKDYKEYRYNSLLIEKIPVIARVFDIDWQKTGQSPYMMTPGKNTFAHYVCIIGKWIAENSWGEDWWDDWLFYFRDEHIPYFSMITRIIV